MLKISSLIFVLLGFALSACNTVEGVGEDVSSAGDAVSEAADKSK